MKKFIVIASVICLFLSSCAPVYVPNARNSPMFTGAGEFQGSFQLGNGLDVQGAVSVSNHIGVMGNFSYANNKSPDPDDQDEFHRHKFFEGGIGYFENDDKWCYEIFAGYGEGEGSSFDDYDFFGNGTSIRATGRFNRFFIQPAFGLNKKVFHVSFVPRISLVDFTEFTSDDASGVAPYIANDDPKLFIEPAVIGRINLMNNRMFFVFQGGVSIPATKVYYEYRAFYVSTGIGFRLGGVKKDAESETE